MAFYRIGGGEVPTGNASEEHVLAQKTFSNDLGTGKTGTMPDNTNSFKSFKLSPARTSIGIPKGYHPGDKTVYFETMDTPAVYATRTGDKVYSYGDFDSEKMKAIKSFTVGGIRLSGTPYVPNTRSASIDMYGNSGATGSPITDARECYRFVNTTKVPNEHNASSIYTYPKNSLGMTVNFASNHTYGGVNATNVYNAGYDTGWAESNLSQLLTFKESKADIGLNPYTFTCDWDGSLIILQLKYDRGDVEVQPLEIEANNTQATWAGPQNDDGTLKPRKRGIHRNSSIADRAQFWIYELYNIRKGAKFTLQQMGAASKQADAIAIFAMVATEGLYHIIYS